MAREPFAAALGSLGRQLVQGLLQLVYPPSCFVCDCSLCNGSGSTQERDICGRCRSLLTTDPFPCCPRCGSSVGPYIALAGGCNACRDQSFHFDRVFRLGPYDGLLRQVILRMKQLSGEELAEVVGELWAAHLEQRLREVKASAIVPTPLHWWRRWQRGYNPSETLALALAARLGIPCQAGWLHRVRNTPQQQQRSAAARRENVRNAFSATARAELRGKTILLVDDVLTTGSTANDAARALRNAGTERVVVAVLAGGHR